MTIENRAFYLFLYLTGVHFQGELQHVGDVSEHKIKTDYIVRRTICNKLIRRVNISLKHL